MKRAHELTLMVGDSREWLSLMEAGNAIIGYSNDRGPIVHQVPEREDPDIPPGRVGRSFSYLYQHESLIVEQVRHVDALAIGFYDGDYRRPAEPEPELTEEEEARLESGDWIFQPWDTGGFPWGYIWYPDDPGRSAWHTASDVEAVMDSKPRDVLHAYFGAHYAAAAQIGAAADRAATVHPRAAALAVSRYRDAQAEADRVAPLRAWLEAYQEALESVPDEVES